MEGAPTTARYRADDITKEWLELKAHVGGKQPEVVRRDRPAEVIVSLAAATALLPEARPKWLSRALESVTAGQTRPSDLFDVFSHARFAAGVSPALAAQMLEDLRQQASCFPEKLRKVILDEELPLGEKKRRAAQRVQAPEKANPAADEMFSRCIDFVRKNESVAQLHTTVSRKPHSSHARRWTSTMYHQDMHDA
ncbi:NRT2.5 [Symbiodinium natans]|uniref:NRT2.5 protein n=1 Tax=Symbiodinium natans TaxID=878477 RepID=A0A812MTR7_9DINO|nr:NRT2.5 [Symbiodinium natans]